MRRKRGRVKSQEKLRWEEKSKWSVSIYRWGGEKTKIIMSGRKSCIWCGEDWPKFYKHKPYCVQCASACKRECRTCHKPYPELRFFKNGSDRCNTCETRWERDQMKKTGGLKLQVADSLPFRLMSPSSDGESADGLEPKLSSSEKNTKNKRKRRTSSSKRIESEMEEEEEEEEVATARQK